MNFVDQCQVTHIEWHVILDRFFQVDPNGNVTVVALWGESFRHGNSYDGSFSLYKKGATFWEGFSMFKKVLKHYQRSASWVFFSFFGWWDTTNIRSNGGHESNFCWHLDDAACHLDNFPNIPPASTWLVVSTHLKNVSQNGNLPQIGVKIANLWNHHQPPISGHRFGRIPTVLNNTPFSGAHQASAKILVTQMVCD